MKERQEKSREERNKWRKIKKRAKTETIAEFKKRKESQNIVVEKDNATTSFRNEESISPKGERSVSVSNARNSEQEKEKDKWMMGTMLKSRKRTHKR